jgi:hypothetical protein
MKHRFSPLYAFLIIRVVQTKSKSRFFDIVVCTWFYSEGFIDITQRIKPDKTCEEQISSLTFKKILMFTCTAIFGKSCVIAIDYKRANDGGRVDSL